jgi:hypothetical protein
MSLIVGGFRSRFLKRHLAVLYRRGGLRAERGRGVTSPIIVLSDN